VRILLSAFSCDPFKGSEPSVGWGWVKILNSKEHEVIVLVSGNHSKKNIELYLEKNSLENTVFKYVELPEFLFKNRRFYPQIYYYIWQIKAYFFAKSISSLNKFDIVHHVTYVNIRHPSFLWSLGDKFIFGPVSGGDSAPSELRKSASIKQRVSYIVRDISKYLTILDPFARKCINKSDVVHVTTDSTLKLIPKNYKGEIKKTFAIAFESNENKFGKELDLDNVKIMYAGMFQHLKGMHLGIKAFANVFNSNYSNISLSMVGDGEEFVNWNKMASNLSVQENIYWKGWLDRDRLLKFYDSHHIFLFPSIQDSGGMVLLEAMSKGLVPIVLDLGGPSEICDQTCAEIVDVSGLKEEDVIKNLEEKIVHLINNPDIYKEKSIKAIERASQFSWEDKYNCVYG